MGLFSNVAIRAWSTLGKIISFFGKLSDAKKRKIKQDEDRILELAQKQRRDLRSFPGFEEIKKEKERINKLEQLSENIPSGYDPNYYFKTLISVLSIMNRTSDTFQLNQIYTFKYIGRTPEWYDLNPVVLVTKASGIYFEGVNFHWRDAASYVESPFRKYRFDRVQSKFYKIMPDELQYVLKVPTFYPVKISSK
jgi:hypothetical protein